MEVSEDTAESTDEDGERLRASARDAKMQNAVTGGMCQHYYGPQGFPQASACGQQLHLVCRL
eukprot:86955-Pelagomonas_calceolata.AAC.1